MIHPRSLPLFVPRPKHTLWRCTVHGDLPEGESTCAKCDEPSALAALFGQVAS